MGDINCHCHIQNNPPQPQNLQQAPLTRQQTSNRKQRSRVNSIVSPRKIAGLHSKKNSSANIISAVDITEKCETVYQKSEQNMMYINLFEKRLKSVQLEIKYYVQIMNGNKTMRQQVGAIKSIKVGSIAIGGSKDKEGNLVKRQEQFSFEAKIINKRLWIRDTGVGLGVFRQVKMGEILQFCFGEQSELEMALIQIGVGQFVILKPVHTRNSNTLTINCSVISKNPVVQFAKPTRSLPSLLTSQQQNPRWPKQTPNYNILLSEGQQRIVQNKMEVEVKNSKIKVTSINKQGFYQYVDGFKKVNEGEIYRLGVELYRVRLSNDRNNDVQYHFQLCP